MLRNFAITVGKDARAAIVGVATLWLLSRIPKIGSWVMPRFWCIVPSQQKAAWFSAVALFLAGIFGLVIAFILLVNKGVMDAAARIRAGTATEQDYLIAHYVLEATKKKHDT